ncbi:hypothetical protein QTN47_11680 [Danxiaibacter flavus]|uniref:Phage tail protein n=1 Tax=Danxiaibacter flavus TaxID=3049108 RepID=A0ABV3ZE58_9BACT|nr:hypothetical protein QNM32_11685 [Chitinophagaceae bacterium DXS]
MSFTKETIFKLLPLFNQVRDQESGNSLVPGQEFDGPLKALLGLIAEQIAVLEENFDQLYDDQFIETCAEWVVPYIGGLVGTRGLITFPGASFSERAQVANTISYRRRKGTAAVLEQLARDVTGWTANVVEYFQLLATTQYLNHLRPTNLSVSALRNWEKMEYVNTPFDKLTRTLDVRNIESRRGKYNIPNVGIFLWRLDSYSITSAPAYKVDDRRYKFDALGKDTQLYNHPVPEDEITHLSTPVNVPMPISRTVMYNYTDDYYGVDRSVFIDDKEFVSICNLSDATDGSGDWVNMPQSKVAVDPVLGRIAFPALQPPPQKVSVNYYYGFSDKIGGGEYARSDSFMSELAVVQVPNQHPTIQAALNVLEQTGGIIEITDNAYYIETPSVKIADGKKIEIRAQDKQRPVLVLDDDLEIFGGENAVLSLNGLLVSGGCLRLPETDGSGKVNQLDSLQVTHCTLLPGPSAQIGTVATQSQQPRLIVEMADVTVKINKSITGAIRASDSSTVYISNSIVDALSDNAVAYCGLNGLDSYGAVLQVENTTVIGKVATRIMQLASNVIFYAASAKDANDILPVTAQRLQEGCVRYSYIPPGSRLPRRFNCQPADDTDATRIRPMFNSLKYGDAAYCQLSRLCAVEITEGADNEAEMGVFRDLYQPQRLTNLRTRLNEYLRFSLQAGIFLAS